MSEDRVLLRAAAVVDGNGLCARPGAILLKHNEIIGSGTPQAIGHIADVRIVDLKDCVLLPGLVNAHAHLDLTHIGPQPSPGSFVAFVDLVRTRRVATVEAIGQSVMQGAVLARAGGTAFIGDIAGVRSLAAVEALRASGLPGVSYLEVFGLGENQERAAEALRTIARQVPAMDRGVALGIQPHAPYSCGRALYESAAALGLPLATHLAETLEELEFVHAATGPLAKMLRDLNVWDRSIKPLNCHPLEHLAEVLAHRPLVAAHLNYIDDRHVQQLSQWPISVAYCPRASRYFGHPHNGYPEHRYREMMQAGVNVALGTDSLICIDTPDRISVLDEMRLLHRRDGTDPRLLLRMSTVNGAAALGVDPELVTLAPGPTAGIIAVPVQAGDHLDPLSAIMESDAAPRWVVACAQ